MSMLSSLVTNYLLIAAVSPLICIHACYIWGTDSGTCITSSQDRKWRSVNMPFCGKAINYPVCVPKSTVIPPSREFPLGRWQNHSIIHKDQWVEDNYFAHVTLQTGYENNRTLQRLNRDINGHMGQIVKRFDHNPDCRNAYKNFFCYINFPRCDVTKDLSFPTCRSVCQNFVKACKYSSDLKRCGKSKYFNGYFAESPSSGGNTYLREFFPGQPFRENKYTKTKAEVAICTPAMVGTASRNVYFSKSYGLLLSILLSVLLCLVFLLYS